MNSDEPDNLIDEARLLMPWYLTNKLSEQEQALVNKALESSAELRKEFLNEEKMMRLVKENSSLLELSALDTTDQRLANTLLRIEQEEQRQDAGETPPHNNRQSSTTWLDKLFGKPLFDFNWLSPANAVFAGLLAVQIGVLGYFQLSGSSAEPQTLYSSASVAQIETNKSDKITFLMEFLDDAQHGEVCDFLNTWNARIVGGPDDMNLFSVEMDANFTNDATTWAETIMQQAAEKKVPVSFVGTQFQNN